MIRSKVQGCKKLSLCVCVLCVCVCCVLCVHVCMCVCVCVRYLKFLSLKVHSTCTASLVRPGNGPVMHLQYNTIQTSAVQCISEDRKGRY